jgi:putative lipoic acid-binding regulatory protein
MSDSGSDTAGPLLGWSLGSGMGRRPLESLMEFPCRHTFKAVGRAEGDFVPSMLARVGAVLGRAVDSGEHSVRQSSGGRYESVTLDLWVESGEQLYAVYEAIYDDERVRYLL